MRSIKAVSTLLLALLICSRVLSQHYKKDSIPPPLGYVNDFENIFSTQQNHFLDSTIRAFEKRTTIQIAIITVDTTMVSKQDFGDYIVKIANRWGIGQKDKNNGIAIGLSRQYRQIRIATGYGMEAKLSNVETKTIIDTAFVPYFKKGQYFEGAVHGLTAVMKKVQ